MKYSKKDRDQAILILAVKASSTDPQIHNSTHSAACALGIEPPNYFAQGGSGNLAMAAWSAVYQARGEALTLASATNADLNGEAEALLQCGWVPE